MKWLARSVWIPIALLVIAFAIANRQSVLISLDPFNQTMPSLGFEMPLWVALFGAAIGGMVLGGIAAWGAQARGALRRSAKKRAQRKAEAEEEAGEEVPIIAPDKPSPMLAPPEPSKKKRAGAPGAAQHHLPA